MVILNQEKKWHHDKKNISKIDDELNKLSKIVESNIDINSIEKMLQ